MKHYERIGRVLTEGELSQYPDIFQHILAAQAINNKLAARKKATKVKLTVRASRKKRGR